MKVTIDYKQIDQNNSEHTEIFTNIKLIRVNEDAVHIQDNVGQGYHLVLGDTIKNIWIKEEGE